jgi:hypothetical protein
MPALSRTANLTIAEDKLLHLLALTNITGVPVFNSTNDTVSLYAPPVRNEDPPSSTYATVNKFPVDTSYVDTYPSNVGFGVANGLDFCYKLRVAEDPPPSDISNIVHALLPGGTRRQQVAYALALPDAMEKGTPNFQNRVFNTGNSDARMRIVTPGALWRRLECGEAIASSGHALPNVATAAVMLYRGLYDLEQVLRQAYYMSRTQYLLAERGRLQAFLNIAGDGANLIYATGKLLAYEFEGAIKMGMILTTMVLTTLSIDSAIAGKKGAERGEKMAWARYKFTSEMRGVMKGFAEEVLQEVRASDARGLFHR